MKKHPVARFCKKVLSWRGIRAITPDSWYLRALFRVNIGRALNLRDPQTFNEKLQWLKLYYRRPELTTIVDKYEVRKYIASKVGEEHLVPLVGGPWNRFDEIDFSTLPDRFVLKTTHDSGGVALCRDKKTFNVDDARRKLERALKRNFYWPAREAPYRRVPPRLVAEQFLDSDADGGLRDYKVYVFNGEARIINVCSHRFTDEGLHVTFYDAQWNLLPIRRKFPRELIPEPTPEALNELLTFSERLAGSLPFVRVDFYLLKGRRYIGELTLYPGAGLEPFEPEEWDATLGSWLDLSVLKAPRSHNP
jgi:hypothetical protein